MSLTSPLSTEADILSRVGQIISTDDSRPGTSDIGEVDRYWHRSLRADAREHGTAIRMLCLATPDGVRELTAAA